MTVSKRSSTAGAKMLFAVILLALAEPSSGAQRITAAPAPCPVDTIYYGGKVLTVDPAFSVQQAFAVSGNRFLSVGTGAEVRKLSLPCTRSVDLGGATIIPGMTDSHDHMIALELMHRGFDLTSAASSAEIIAFLRSRLQTARPGETIYGSIPWRSSITRADIDPLSFSNPIVLLRLRRGFALINHIALAKIGVSRTSPSLAGVAMPVDASGEPTGEMPPWPTGLHAISALLPPMPDNEADELVLRGQNVRNALGLTAIRDLSNLSEWMKIYARMNRQRRLTLRVSMGLSLPERPNPASPLEDQLAPAGFGDDWLRLDSVGEDPSPPAMSSPAFTAYVRRVNQLNWRVSPHIGFGAMEAALAALEAADRDKSIAPGRWTIEHANGATGPQMVRMARLGVAASVQAFGALFGPMSAQEENRQWPVHDFLTHGVLVISGSDTIGTALGRESPSENPFFNLQFYVTRVRDGRIVAPDQAVSRAEALRLVTINPAIVMFQERDRGSIEAGKLADFIVLAEDYMTIDPHKIGSIAVLATFIDGRQVYSANRTKAAGKLGRSATSCKPSFESSASLTSRAGPSRKRASSSCLASGPAISHVFVRDVPRIGLKLSDSMRSVATHRPPLATRQPRLTQRHRAARADFSR